VIGVWTTTERDRVRITGGDSYGGKVQVSRLGNPLVNEVVVPAGLKDTFNATPPSRDAKIPALVKRVTNPELPRLIEKIYEVPAPKEPRNDLAEIFLTGITTKAGGPIKADLNSQLNNADVRPGGFTPAEMLRLNLSVPLAASPKRLGVLDGDLQGFPNGRRLTDDVVDISVQAVEGAAQTGKIVDALATGDKVDVNDNGFADRFPYVALPNSTGATAPGAGSSGASQAGQSGQSGASGQANHAGQPASPGAAGNGLPDSDMSPGAAAPASDDGGGMTTPVAYVTGAIGIGVLLLALGLFTFLRRRRRRPAGGYQDPNQTMRL
jgi:hypothetical protein